MESAFKVEFKGLQDQAANQYLASFDQALEQVRVL